MESATGQLILNGQPFLILGGELGNSSAGTAAQADFIVPKLAAMHVNTILMPVAWEQVEPKEGSFDFSILDHWIGTAQKHNMHLVLLWFGSWKNAFSNYAPSWVKSDPKRFPRAESADGKPLEILSTLSPETRRCDSRAFAALMRHIRERDFQQTAVLMVQVENEVGYLGPGRDRSPDANRLFHGRVPDVLIRSLAAKRLQLAPELAAHFNERGKSWSEVFGDAADEVFMAWSYAAFIEAVTQAGKTEYALPMYVNAQLPAPLERAGARVHPVSISTRPISTGPTSNIGYSDIAFLAMQSLSLRHELKVLLTAPCTLTAKRALSASVRSRLIAWCSQRRTATLNRR